MKCINCGFEMRLDDVDFNYKGNKDNYWVCDECNCGTVEKIRGGNVVGISSVLEDGTSINQDLLSKRDFTLREEN